VTGNNESSRDSSGLRKGIRLEGLWLTDNHITDLNYWCLNPVIRNIDHDLLHVGAKPSLECCYRIAIDVAHGNIHRRLARPHACDTLVYGVEVAAITHAGLYEWRMGLAGLKLPD
jgi:hypothetical protein